LIWEKIYDKETPFELISDEPYPYDVQKRISDTSKARNLLNFEANTTIDEVLDEVIPWVRLAINNQLI